MEFQKYMTHQTYLTECVMTLCSFQVTSARMRHEKLRFKSLFKRGSSPGSGGAIPKQPQQVMGYVHQLNSVDGRTYQSILPQPIVWRLGLIKELG